MLLEAASSSLEVGMRLIDAEPRAMKRMEMIKAITHFQEVCYFFAFFSTLPFVSGRLSIGALRFSSVSYKT